MQIGPGQAPLSLAILKALGAQSAAAPASAAKTVAGPPAPGGGAKAAATAPGGDAAATRSLPRGSFLDLRV